MSTFNLWVSVSTKVKAGTGLPTIAKVLPKSSYQYRSLSPNYILTSHLTERQTSSPAAFVSMAKSLQVSTQVFLMFPFS